MDFGTRLRSGRYRVTPQREVVYEVLERSRGRPLNTEEIYRSCAESRSGMGLATVYRTLELFCDLGIAHHVHLHESSSYYELTAEDHHHHLVCVGCGSVEPFRACLVGDMETMVRDEHDFLVTSHCLSLFGYCPDCLPAGRPGS